MKLNFLVVTDDPYTIEEAVSKGLLKKGDWFEHKGDLYLLVGQYENGCVGVRLKRDGIKEEDIRGYYKYVVCENTNENEMYYVSYDNRLISYDFGLGEEIKLVWVK